MDYVVSGAELHVVGVFITNTAFFISCARTYILANSPRRGHISSIMPLLDQISDLAHKLAPSKSHKPSGLSGGIGNGHGMVAPEDDVS